MHISDEDDASASYSVGRSEFEDDTSTYAPGFDRLVFHMMDRRGKL